MLSVPALMLGNPVPGRIRAFGESGPGFGVTAPFGAIDAFHPPPGHQGIDLGNGRRGDPVLAVEDGVVNEILTAPNGARIVRYVLTRFPDYQAAIAHMDTFEVNKGQKVLRGQMIGHVGASGTTAAHLHAGMKHKGIEIDWWPLLDQNQEDADLDPSFSPKPNATVTVKAKTRHRLAPVTTDAANIAIASDPGGPLGFPLLGTVVGEAVGGNAIWYAYWRPETSKVYFLHTAACGPETPWELVDCTSATKPLQAKIDAARSALA